MEYLIIIMITILYFSYKYAWWTRTINLNYPRILMYHMISDHKKNAKFNDIVASFGIAQMKSLNYSP